jgi:hypothetical protein
LRKLRTIGLALVAILAVITALTQPRKSNLAGAELLSGAQIPPEVLATLKRSCADCHSEATRYPWYSYIAPTSWLVTDDVASGRRHLNFSAWSDYPMVRRQRALSEIANQVRDRGMPPSIYTLIHRDAVLSDTDIDTIFRWTQGERARLIESTLR